MIFAFEDFELDEDRLELRRGGSRVEVQPKPLRLLFHLVRHRERTLDKGELFDRVWPDVIVGESALSSALREARRALGDDGKAPRLIETLRGRGYRFIAPVEERRKPGDPSTDRASQPEAAAPATPFASERYRLERFLGEGARKQVYLARDTKLDRDVAIGVIKTDGLDPESRQRVEREVRAMGRLGEHPHIVNIYDVVEEAGLLYFVGQYASGGDLARRLREAPNRRLPLADVLRLADELCQALEHAHTHGVLHRDIKPSNVYLAEDSAALLGDFGLAVSIDRSRTTPNRMIVGTVAYMPPEQALGQPPTPRGDLYALGALLYESVAGRPPFFGEDPVAVISQHINATPVAPSWHEPELSRGLEALILALLAKDPGARPESAEQVREALREIAKDPKRLAAVAKTRLNPLDRLASGIFVGRERELAQLRAGLDFALSGRPQIPLLVGEPGIGKTRTAEELATYARMRGVQVLWGRCYERAGAPAYWPWVQILRSYVRDCDRETLRSEMGPAAADIGAVVSEVRERLPGLPAPPAAEPEEARFRLFEGIVGFLRNASLRQPLAIVLDDLHWADPASLLLLEFLALELGRARVLVVGTYRDVEVSREHPLARTLAELSRSEQSERILLRGLSREDVASFIERTSHIEPPRALVAAVSRKTEGNPFFVHEVVRLLASDGRLERAREIDSWSLEIPEGAREVVGRRLNRVSEACSQALRVAAVVGRDFETRVLARVADCSVEALLEALDEALGARLIETIRDVGGRYRFAHALVQQTLYEELNTPRRARLHQRVGEVLDEVHGTRPGPHLAEIAHHFYEAMRDLGGAERAVDAAVRAGQWARDQLAWEDAARHYRHAVEAFELGDEIDETQLCELLLELGALEIQAGDLAARFESSLRAVELARRLGASELFARAALLYQAGGSLDQGLTDQTAMTLFEEALERIGPEDSSLRARLLHSLAFETTDIDRARPYWREAREIAARLGDPVLLFAVSNFVFDREMSEWLSLAEERVRLAPEFGRGSEFRELSTRAAARMIVGDVAGVRADLETQAQLAEELPGWISRYWCVAHRATCSILAGELEAGRRLAREALELGQRAQGNNALLAYSGQMFVIWHHRGTMRSSPEFAAVAEREVPLFRSLLARMYAAEDAREQAGHQFELLARRGFENVPRHWIWGPTLCWTAEVCVYLGDEQRAAPLYELLRPYARFHAVITDLLTVHMGPFGLRLGMLAKLLGRPSEAEEHSAAATGVRSSARRTGASFGTPYTTTACLAKL